MSDLVNELRQGSSNKDDYRWKAADRIAQLEAALREIAGMDEVALIEFKKGDGWLHQRVARAALGEERT